MLPADTASADSGTVPAVPPAVRVTRSRRQHRLTPIGVVVAVAVLAAFPALVGAGTTATLVDVFILLTMASMWNLLAGYAGLVSIGQQTFIGLGAYAVLILAQWGMQPYLALPLAVVGCAIAALPISWLLLRLRGGYFAIATWVVADSVQLIVSRFPSLGGGTGTILPGASGIDPTTRLAWTYWASLAVVVLALATVYVVLRGRLGLVLTAIRDDEIGARSAGSDVASAKRIVFLVAAAGCGAAGGLLLLSQLNVQSSSVFSVSWSAKMIFVVIIGGIGSIEGPIVGTIVYFALQTALAPYGAWYFIVLGVVAIVVALWAPRGIWGAIARRFNLHPFPTGYWLWATDRSTADDAPTPGARQQRMTTDA